jgi:integrase
MKVLEKASPPVLVRAWPITSELREFTAFMVNSFLRPGDAISLRHRDVEAKVSPQGQPYLKLTSTSSKTTLDPVVTMPKAVEIYRRLKAKAAARGLAGPDDFVFLPERKKRAFAMEVMRRQFTYVLDQEGLAETNLGEARTLYSLRHTAIMFRLLYGDIDLLTLARACRTSVEMLDRFYARGLHAEMNIDRIHATRAGVEFAPA